MINYEIVSNREMIHHVQADWFDYNEDRQAMFYIDKNPPELVAAFNNPVSITKIVLAEIKQ